MSKWKFWQKVKETPPKKTWWRLKSVCPTCGRFHEIETRQSHLYEYFKTGQMTLEDYQ